MNEKQKKHLISLLKKDFDKYLKLRMQGYCKLDYEIAGLYGLGHEFLQELKERYFKVFNSEL